MNELIDFEALKLSLASQDDIKAWSHGEITKPETINYRTLKPEKDGLFDERIFGPTKDWECYCGKYKRIRYRGIVCDKCGVEVTQSRVRRERMGHITLAAPVIHNWFFKGSPSKLGLLLDMSPRSLDAVVYFASFIVIEIDEEKRKGIVAQLEIDLEAKRKQLQEALKLQIEEEEKEAKKQIGQIKPSKGGATEQTDLKIEELSLTSRQKQVKLRDENAQEIARLGEIYKNINSMVASVKLLDLISEDEYYKLDDYNAADFIKIGMGAEALLQVLESIDLSKLSAATREELTHASAQRQIKATKKLRVVESLRKASIKPSWMVIKVLPVLPPDLRPMVQLSGGRFATSDLNDLYRRVINRNNRLKKLIELGAPEIILRNEKRMLQEAVDALIDSQRVKLSRNSQELRSLSDMLRGKQGRFRQNLLGKRVDYSGRSVIVVGPDLSLNQAGIPKEMALEMFKPFVLREVIGRGYAPNVKSAKHYLERRSGEVWDILEDITRNHPILLNRAPTLHRLGIQAFYPILIEGDAIRIHPSIFSGFNADFDGDQMAVHVPLSEQSQKEAASLMMAARNLVRPADGSPITLPNKEMALGAYYLTLQDANPVLESVFGSFEEVVLALSLGKIQKRQLIKVKYGKEILETTPGRVRFNMLLPESMRFINEVVGAASIKKLINRAIDELPEEEVVDLIDRLKGLGFEGATNSGLSVSVFDCMIVSDKPVIIQRAEKEIETIEKNFKMGLITKDEEKRLSQEVWLSVTNELADLTWKNLPLDNSIKIISDSGGSRATAEQIKQLSAIRGLVTDPSGNIVPLPVKSNFREGLSVFEYFTSARGARKGLADRAIKTAESGYLTRRLVDVAHDAIIRIEDCGTSNGLVMSKHDKRQAHLISRITGRVVAVDVVAPKGKKVIVPAGSQITDKSALEIEAAGIEEVMVRSVLTCESRYGLCSKCYGKDLVTRKPVELGTPVGVIAAQSIGEPGTQLTMRTFHTGGIVGLDITQGLPRVEELLETRIPKYAAQISEIAGKVTIEETAEGYNVKVKSTNLKPAVEREYFVPPTSELAVTDGDLVAAGTPLSAGYLDIKEVLAISGLRPAQQYIIDGCQEVYESQGVAINDKHFEVIARKMSEKVRVETSGDTILLPGELIDKNKFHEENAKVLAEGGEPSTAQVVVLGITRAALYTESFLSAASFQETTRVLTEAAIEGKVDHLIGLKENVIIGRLIPTSPERAKIE